ncbi:MAG: FG-GAP-like repeat-containing protein [Pyrinomonadaceae bacterium]
MKYEIPSKLPYRFIRALCVSLAATLFVAAVPILANAAPGDLDTLFGIGGRILPLGAPVVSDAFSVAIQTDNKVLVAGVERDFLSWPPSGSQRLVLTRYLPNGSLDLTFGQGGRVLTLISPGCHSHGDDLVLQPDGKVVLIGHQDGCGTESGPYAFRYMPDGSLDPTFDGDGKLQILSGIPDLGFSTTSCRAAVQSDGKLVLSCGEWMWEEDYWKVILRLNPDGSPDASFGGGIGGPGRVYLHTSDYHPLDIAIQSDGKIVGAGEYDRTNGKNVGLVRLNTDGSYDGSFGSSGWSFTSAGIGVEPDARAIALQPDNKIVVAGNWLSQNTRRGLVIRYLPNGSLDTSFGASGVIFSGNPSDSYSSIAIQSNGKILVGSGSRGYGITRFLGSGVLDDSLGINGQVFTDFPGEAGATYLNGWVGDLAIQRNGRIISAGSWQGHEGWPDVQLSFRYQAIARYIGDSKAAYDYDGDGRADTTVRRPSDNTWHLLRGTAGYTAMQFGVAGDMMAPADYDGDGKTDVAVFRPSNGRWYVYMSQSQAFQQFGWGQDGDLPVPTDRDGDGKADLVIYRPSNGTWYTRFSNETFDTFQFGVAGDKPMLGDFDGDGKGDVALSRPSNNNWYILKSSLGFFVQTWGQSGDIPLTGDFDGDGATDHAVFRPSTGQWFLSMTTAGFSSQNWGQNGDIPVPADYDGDGRADVAVFRPSNATWYIVNSTAGILIQQFGETEDIPTPSAFNH